MKNQNGFTLIELMMSLAVSVMVAYGIYLALNAEEMQRQTSERKMNIQDSAREGLYKMVQEIRLSAPGRVTITTPSAGHDVIQFQIPNSATPVNTDPADSVTDFSTDWTTAQVIQYARGGSSCNKVIRSVCAGGVCPAATCTDTLQSNQSVVANSVSSLSFNNTAYPNEVVANLQVQGTLYSRGQRNLSVNSGVSAPLVMTAKAKLRNS